MWLATGGRSGVNDRVDILKNRKIPVFADWLIRTRNVTPGPDRVSHCAVFLLVAKYLDPEMAPEVEAMIDELGLMFIKAEKIETKD